VSNDRQVHTRITTMALMATESIFSHCSRCASMALAPLAGIVTVLILPTSVFSAACELSDECVERSVRE
jgi:hypothetical protein